MFEEPLPVWDQALPFSDSESSTGPMLGSQMGGVGQEEGEAWQAQAVPPSA